MSFQLITLERINSFPVNRLENSLLTEWIQARYDWRKCADNRFHLASDCTVCEGCDNCFYNEDTTKVYTSCGRRQNRTSEFLCNSCLNHTFTCGDCSDRFADNCQGGGNTNGEPVCERCAEQYSCCERCNDTFACEDLDEDGRCQTCSSRNIRNRNGILPYSTDVSLPFYGKGPIYFGVELEVERKPDADDDLPGVRNAVGGWAILKDDGSLDDGYEVVTAPMDVQSHRKYWPQFLAVSEGLLSFKTKTCGLHVHVSRRTLSRLQIAKIVCFVNSAANRDFMTTIAQRNSDQWSKYSEKRLADSAKKDVSRYQAVNLLNDETIEFRIFKGTLKQSSLFSAIEFCEAIVSYCQPSSRPIQWCLDSIRFCGFVSENRKLWPHLSEFIKTKWITKWKDNNTDSTTEI